MKNSNQGKGKEANDPKLANGKQHAEQNKSDRKRGSTVTPDYSNGDFTPLSETKSSNKGQGPAVENL